jgi:NADH:ubiquinone oxidoreductase subunit 6 (subunit J)
MSETVNAVGFGMLAIVLVGSVIGMLATKNIVRAGFWMLGASVAAGGVYYLLDADYIALVQILVYAGAVSVIIIFSIMITLRRREDAERGRDFSLQAAALALVFCAGMLIAITGFQGQVAEMPATAPDLVDFGRRLFSPDGWALPSVRSGGQGKVRSKSGRGNSGVSLPRGSFIFIGIVRRSF